MCKGVSTLGPVWIPMRCDNGSRFGCWFVNYQQEDRCWGYGDELASWYVVVEIEIEGLGFWVSWLLMKSSG